MSVTTASWPFGNRFLVKLAIGGAVVLLAAWLATPNLMRSRSSADEAGRWVASQQMYEGTRSQDLALHDAAPVSLSRTDI
jgi:hypothetical protein